MRVAVTCFMLITTVAQGQARVEETAEPIRALMAVLVTGTAQESARGPVILNAIPRRGAAPHDSVTLAALRPLVFRVVNFDSVKVVDTTYATISAGPKANDSYSIVVEECSLSRNPGILDMLQPQVVAGDSRGALRLRRGAPSGAKVTPLPEKPPPFGPDSAPVHA